MEKFNPMDNSEWGILAFIMAIAGLVVAVSLGKISEPTFVQLFTPCLVGIGSLANPNLKNLLGRMPKRKIKPVRTGGPTTG